ncbi:hypothetical protein ACERJO_16690 [Halalkalibacter sp. AB-rgal2]|uniref:hypothetical protein n=1 Tax=Halalkalibacter sp. AB-rgal2 TaxID=3242695 RepID=UPI00359CE222
MKKLVVALISVAVIFLIPFVLWHFEKSDELNIAIIDKTVPDESYREHHGLTWLLNHWRVTEERLSASEDYQGFRPNEKEESYDIQQLLTDYDGIDLIYLADTYGVYEEDLPWVNENEREGSRSNLIYGGLEVEEWYNIYTRLTDGTRSTLVAEFNTFASPTNTEVQSSVSNFLGIDWSGWVGRYFDELDPELNEEIPQWILDEYPEWDYEGSGFVIVNDLNYDLVVLLEEEHVEKGGIRLQFTEQGQEFFDLEKSPEYAYWFDIIEAREEDHVLATYDWPLTSLGEEMLIEKGIPLQFDAVIHRQEGPSDRFYFAGDYVDVAEIPSFYQYKWMAHLQTWRKGFSKEENAFFWTTYVPMMEIIINRAGEEIEYEPVTEDGLNETKEYPSIGENQYNFRIVGDLYEVYVDGQWEEMTIKGVNMGMGKPGSFPGEAMISEEEYRRWFNYIGEMGANTIRVYTIHPPGFYRALKAYNEANPDQPLYLFHGVWFNEESEVYEETKDAFVGGNTIPFQEEMKMIVDVIHGDTRIEYTPGHAYGIYDVDVSDYVIGWIIGIEWYPRFVEETNDVHSDLGDYDGRFVKTENAEAFEYWLAEQMDLVLSYEADHYGFVRPISFTNWVTTDLLTHPAEPNEEEDLVGIDPNVVKLKDGMEEVGQFASYHVYPYYPDFLNFEERYLEYTDHRGQPNNYAAYLEDLHEVHDIPVLIAEFGVPATRGKTHNNPFGWNQGHLAEDEQGEIVVSLFEDILHEGMMGGLIFTWQDEWFKRTWNTMEYDNPERRPYWSNPQTSEQQFGLMSFDRHKIRINGSPSEWEESVPLYDDGDELLEQFIVDHDETYMYLRIDLNDFDWSKDAFPVVLFDTIPDQGNEQIEGFDGLSLNNGIDFMMKLKGKKSSSLLVDWYYDFFEYEYVHVHMMIDWDIDNPKPVNNTGVFNPIMYALNQALYIPSRDLHVDFEDYETGKLRYGIGDPDHEDYDSLADFYYNEELQMFEVRIPWLLLQFRDPSQREVIGDFYKDPYEFSQFVDGIQLAVLIVNEQEDSYEILDSFPALENGRFSEPLELYEWETWDLPLYEERLKQSYDAVKEAFRAIE